MATDDGLVPLELVEEAADADLAPDRLGFAAERIMDAEVATLILHAMWRAGAPYKDAACA